MPASPIPKNKLAERFAALWENASQPPDVFAFLRGADEASPEDRLAVLRVDRRRRQESGLPIPTQEYLRHCPDLDEQAMQELMGGASISHSRSLANSDNTRPAEPGDVTRVTLPNLTDQPQTGPAEDELLTAMDTVELDAGIENRIGRYRLIRVLGQGAYGQVWLGHDDELRRYVAIKLPTPQRLAQPEEAETYLSEARTLASLDHPNIVPVFDVGKTDAGCCYVVSKFIEGSDLAQGMRKGRLPAADSVELITTIAQALHHAHEHGLIHRDIKPANILIEESGKPFVADFGLAVRETDPARGVVGTPAYMSPEQALGEGHRLDRRSDIFAIGVVLYQLLTGERPFQGSTTTEVLDQVIWSDPTPPRERDQSIPVELERICLKALAKRASDRYASAAELADDLCCWKSGPLAEPTPATIIPRGLRSFDASDAGFFLQLLPGPRDREGLPECIRFWKTRIEETDPDETFTVGLIYGPSGCGKSSLVKAALLPRLARHVTPVYVEATPEDTEIRILRALHKSIGSLPDDLDVAQAFTGLRRDGPADGRKVIVVLDQFEQWLHAARSTQNTRLLAALRQCDGRRIQCIVMVRDDFWMAATRLMRDLDIRLVDGQNAAAVDLFGKQHARRVLIELGRAYDCLPASLDEEQQAFVEDAVGCLSENGKVVPVRIALLAEMLKEKPWNRDTLQKLGGTEGIGVTFLEENFSTTSAPPEHRLHQRAARAVLQTLLPEHGTSIRGSKRSYDELLACSGYQSQPAHFDDLLDILDGRLRLITPTDPEGLETPAGRDTVSRHYQLTHDYLVPSLREWLTRRQRETPRGRAELALAERASLWIGRPENRYLPSCWEWLRIRWLTNKRKWSQPEHRLMRWAGYYYCRRAALWAVLLAVIVATGWWARSRVLQDRHRQQCQGLISTLLNAETAEVPDLVAKLAPFQPWADPKLRQVVQSTPNTSKEHLHASLALLSVDAQQVPYLRARLLSAGPDELPVIRDALSSRSSHLTDELWKVLQGPSRGAQILPTAGALARYDPDSVRWNDVAGAVSTELGLRPRPCFCESGCKRWHRSVTI